MMKRLVLLLLLLVWAATMAHGQAMPPMPQWPDDWQNPSQSEPPLVDDEPESEPEPEHVDPERLKQAIDKGLSYLVETQQIYETDDGKKAGYWINDVGYKRGTTYQVTGRDAKHPGVTAIACMAFMANGHMPNRGKYGDVVMRGLRFVLECGDRTQEGIPGYISSDGSRMYSHSFGALFLAQVVGMGNTYDRDFTEKLRNTLRASIAMIVQSQNEEGGWRYSPMQVDSDVSTVVCQLQALRAAAQVGIRVPVRVINKAKQYVTRCYQSNTGRFRYEADSNYIRDTWTLTAAGMVALQQAGNYNSFIDREGRRTSWNRTVDVLMGCHDHDFGNFGQVTPFSYMYGYYYATQAIYQVGRNKPELWKEFRTRAYRNILSHQKHPEGYWPDQIGESYGTAMAVLAMSMEKEYLPIFQK